MRSHADKKFNHNYSVIGAIAISVCVCMCVLMIK